MKWWTCSLAVLSCVAVSSHGYDILAVFPYQGPSHQMVYQAVVGILLKAGHHVTTFTSVPMKETNSTHHRQFFFVPTISSWTDLFEYHEQATRSSREAWMDLDKLSEGFTIPLYKSPDFQKLIAGNGRFDLVLIEPFFMQEALVFLGHRFKAPVASLATANTESNQDHYMGRHRNPALDPEWVTCFSSDTPPFLDRARNTFRWIENLLEHRLYYLPKREGDLREHVFYPGMDSMPPIEDLLSEISVTFANTHPLVQFSTPLPPNLVFIPGVHIKSKTTLPQEMKSLLDGAKEGFIVFSMGTMAPVSKMKEERDVFIRALSQLPLLVLWKSDINLPGLPANIKTFKWLPQQGVLAHENCKALMTHGGMLSKQEALYYGVPLVTIPLFGDQQANGGHSQAAGFGLTIQFLNITEEKILSALTAVINEKMYKERLSEYSEIYRESVKESEGKIIGWIDHVIRYKGAAYLRRDTQLYWFQYYLIDVLSLFILIISLAVIILIKCAQGLYRIRFPRRPDSLIKGKIKTN